MFLQLAVVCCFVVMLFLPPPALAAAGGATEELFEQSQRWLQAGDFVKARDGFARCWKEFGAARGEEHQLTLDARIFYGQLLTMTGRADLGMNVLGALLDQPGRAGLIASGSFALALRQSGQPGRAVKLLRKNLDRFTVETPEDYIHLGRFHSEISVSLAYLKRYREAEEHARVALRTLDAAHLPPQAHRPCLLTILGQIYLLSGRDQEAAATLAEAEVASRPFWSEWHPENAILQGALGILALRHGRYDEAERRTRLSLAAMERLLGPDHGEVGMIARQLAGIMKKQRRKEEAKQWEARARRIFDRIEGQPEPVSAWAFR